MFSHGLGSLLSGEASLGGLQVSCLLAVSSCVLPPHAERQSSTVPSPSDKDTSLAGSGLGPVALSAALQAASPSTVTAGLRVPAQDFGGGLGTVPHTWRAPSVITVVVTTAVTTVTSMAALLPLPPTVPPPPAVQLVSLNNQPVYPPLRLTPALRLRGPLSQPVCESRESPFSDLVSCPQSVSFCRVTPGSPSRKTACFIAKRRLMPIEKHARACAHAHTRSHTWTRTHA